MTYSPSTGLRGLRRRVNNQWAGSKRQKRGALFLRAHGFIAGGVLALEGADEPF